ncbi:MAG: hypothetical protein WCI22_00150 [Actinomycetota bacterium]
MADTPQRPTPNDGARADAVPPVCMSCGGPHARPWASADGRALLCPPCATLHGFGCP